MNDKYISSSKTKDRINRLAEKMKPADLENILINADKIRNKFLKSDSLKKYMKYFDLFINMIKDYVKGNYREIPWRSIAAVAVVLIWVLNPFDAIFDYLPIIGITDDVTAVAVCIGLLKDDILKYETWKANPAS